MNIFGIHAFHSKTGNPNNTDITLPLKKPLHTENNGIPPDLQSPVSHQNTNINTQAHNLSQTVLD